jgi:hypothetical protein
MGPCDGCRIGESNNHGHTRGLAAILLLALLQLQACGRAVEGQTTFQGRPVQYWAEKLNADQIDELVNGGGTSVPILIECLDDRRWQVRDKAIVALAKLEGTAQAAIPKLLEIMTKRGKSGDPDGLSGGLLAAAALGKIGQAAVPNLVDLLKSSDKDTRYRAVLALGLVRPAPKEALPAIRALLQDTDGEVREAAATAVASIEKSL